MIAKNSLTGSGFYSILEAPKILLLKFLFLYFQFLFLEIFLIPFLFSCFSFEFFFLIYKFLFSHNFWFSVLQVLQWAGVLFFCLEIFQVAKFSQTSEFRNLRNFADYIVHLPAPFIFRLLQTLCFLHPPLIFLFSFRTSH